VCPAISQIQFLTYYYKNETCQDRGVTNYYETGEEGAEGETKYLKISGDRIN